MQGSSMNVDMGKKSLILLLRFPKQGTVALLVRRH